MITSAEPEAVWDDVVVGAGSAGAVLASRLCEGPDRRLLLVEAGGGIDASQTPDLLGRPVLQGYNWDYDAYIGSEPGVRPSPYRVGKVVGGSSAVNGAIALRGLPGDFARWAASGNSEWCWERVLPYFTKIEADADFGGDQHGCQGPIPIRRRPVGEYDPMATAFSMACRDLGLPDLPDLNDGPRLGVGPVPANTRGGHRMSSAEAYLTPPRPNLCLWERCHVVSVCLDGRRAVGVEVIRDGRLERVAARRVTLSAGAVNTPLILMRSGIGPAARLAAAGVRTRIDLPGVGENLVDHPVMAVWSVPRTASPSPGPFGHVVMARVATSGGEPDVTLTMASNAGIPDMPGIGKILGGRICVGVSAMLLDPASRGSIRMPDPAPLARPVITLALASAAPDVDRLMRGLRLAWAVVRSPPLAGLLNPPLLWTDRLIADDRLLRDAVPKFVAPMWHPAGTARMGCPQDPMAVVDQYLRVRGVDGLRVVDASVMPSLPSATPNLTCIMLAERAAEWMKQQR